MDEMHDLRLRLTRPSTDFQGAVDSRVILTRFLQSATSYADSLTGPESAPKFVLSSSASTRVPRHSDDTTRPSTDANDTSKSFIVPTSDFGSAPVANEGANLAHRKHRVARDVEINLTFNAGLNFSNNNKP